MPCLFGSDAKVQVMTVHAALAAQRASAFAAGDPFILAGDFNLTPDSAPYRLLTTGVSPRPPLHTYSIDTCRWLHATHATGCCHHRLAP